MKRLPALLALLVMLGILGLAANRTLPEDARRLFPVMEALRPLHRPITPPGPSDWLSNHEEPGQTFRQYVKSRPVTPRRGRNILYIQPLGEFSAAQHEVLALTAEYMSQYFNLAVRTKEAMPLSAVPDTAQRVHPVWGDRQILTTHVLDVLANRLPENAAAMIAFTAADLWPGDDWNFVFGQASIRRRVGVWSIYRNGDPERDEAGFRGCLRRTIKTAVHETGHMFSMYHCIAYECCMCGSNHQEEADRRPMYLCPECVAKVCWATQTDPVARYRRLAEFCGKNGLTEERAFFDTSIRILEP